ncbi:hypothetical protein J437_LFUL002163 [Ladona fulva]|uniref:ADP-ribosylation factor-like protein 2-binding protein n=1 Tax=Ladona fulva TaxID=123851 RepID=A0A8K0JY13_LADFU|nr:hypothetical protein J437_LFUL002163 [Ladona fulva]
MSNLLEDFDSLQNDNEETSFSMVSSEDKQFDTIVGHIEDILIDKEFQLLQSSFLDKYFHYFTPGEENKLEYMEIFKEYTNIIENYIEVKLISLLPSFSMDAFVMQLEKRKDKIEGEVFELLFSFSDFLTFKDLILDYRATKEGKVQGLENCIMVSPIFKS